MQGGRKDGGRGGTKEGTEGRRKYGSRKEGKEMRSEGNGEEEKKN